MLIKASRQEYELNESDRVLFNGSGYSLITRKLGCGDRSYNPVISKALMKKLIKEGHMTLSEEKYKGLHGVFFDLYKVAEQK